jgi:nucleotide-sensitive chloride channel 1A
MLSPLNAPPTYITPEEHTSLTSSTPTSFVDIPPVLRWSDEAVEVSLAPHDGFWAGKVKGQLWVTEE